MNVHCVAYFLFSVGNSLFSRVKSTIMVGKTGLDASKQHYVNILRRFQAKDSEINQLVMQKRLIIYLNRQLEDFKSPDSQQERLPSETAGSQACAP